MEKNNGPCYDCKEVIQYSHHACERCYRHICAGCNTKYNLHATINFNNRVNNKR